MMQRLIFMPIYIFLFVLKIYDSIKVTSRKKETVINRKCYATYKSGNCNKRFFFYKIYFVNSNYKIKDKSWKNVVRLHKQRQHELVEHGGTNKGKIVNEHKCEQDLVIGNKEDKEENQMKTETKKDIKKRANKKSSKEKISNKKSSKEKISKEKSSKEKISKEKSSKEKSSKEKSSKEKSSKEKSSKEKSSKEKISNKKYSKKESLKKRLTLEALNEIVQKEETKETDKKNEKNEIEEYDILKYFKIQKDGSIIGEIDAEENKKIINSTYMKKLLKEHNLKEEDILNNIKKSEENIEGVFNSQNVEKHLEEEAKENETFFTTFMNDTNNNIYNEELFNFRTISRKLKNVLKEVIQLFLMKAEKQFRELMGTKTTLENIHNSEDSLQSFVSLLKNEYLFADLPKDTLLEVTRKAVLLSYLNKTFSNNFENFEWHRTLENNINTSVKNTGVKIKSVIYSLNSISITLRSKKEYTLVESAKLYDEHENVEDVIKTSLQEYENENNLNFVNTFNIYISLN